MFNLGLFFNFLWQDQISFLGFISEELIERLERAKAVKIILDLLSVSIVFLHFQTITFVQIMSLTLACLLR